MRYVSKTIAALFCILLAASPAGSGSIPLLGVGKATTVVAGFQGLGDVKSGATSYWGLRAYNAAYANGTNPIADLVASTGGAAVCTLRVATTGKVDVTASYCAGTTPPLACAAASGGSCKVTKVYDQISTNHMVQATLANMPDLNFSALSGLPGLVFTAGSSTEMIATTVSFTTGSSFSGVLKTQTGLGGYWGAPGGGNLLYTNGVNTGNIDEGTVATFTLSDSAYHAINFAGNGASSTVYVDGASTGISPGTTARSLDRIGQVNGFFSSMQFFELGVYVGTIFSGTEEANLNSNQHGSNGWSF